MARQGLLEKRVVDALRDSGELTVREVLAALGSSHAYTTIMTVLDRLHGKRDVRRRKRGQAWAYRATRTREAELGAELSQMLSAKGLDREPLLMAFLDSADAADPQLLDRLDDLIRQRRRDQK